MASAAILLSNHMHRGSLLTAPCHWTKGRRGWVHKELQLLDRHIEQSIHAFRLPSYLGKVSHDLARLVWIGCGPST